MGNTVINEEAISHYRRHAFKILGQLLQNIEKIPKIATPRMALDFAKKKGIFD